MQKVMAALSGGVDSSVAVFLLQKAGYDCSGSIMTLHAPSPESVADARSVANRLSIPFYVMDCQDLFHKCVIGDFIAAYERGDTPNPCVTCNRHLKFTHFLNEATALGCDMIATGHYARIRKDESTGRYLLLRAKDSAKDQSYFLYMLTQSQLCRVLFPLGELTKPEVRQIAEENGFVNARRKDSQDICFVPDGDYASFIEQNTGFVSLEGDYVDINQKFLGKHKGVIHYTLGQRKGLGIALGKPQFVIDKNSETNQVVLGDEEHLFSREVIVKDVNFIPFDDLENEMRVTAKLRYRHNAQPATISKLSNGMVKITFDEPQRAASPGQAAVFYDGDIVVGGGIIV